MSTKKHSPPPKRSEALSGRLSKSASELSCSSPVRTAPPRARSAHHHTPLSVVHRTQHFFNNLKSRWHRSKSRERCPAGTVFSLAPGHDSSGTEYAADQSSEHSTPATSPRRGKKESPLPSNANIEEINQMMDWFSDSEEIQCQSHSASPTEQRTVEESSAAVIEDITQHPSPDCTINHLDFDCDNHFCPWFVEKDNISQLQSVDSTYTNSVYTPQANTPLSSFSEASPQGSRKRIFNQRKDKGNIRRRHVAEWKDNKRKMLRNLGKEYESRDGTVRCGKSLGPTCHMNCRLKCSMKMSNEERILIFNRFWGLGNREKQWAFIANLVVKQKKRRVFTDTESRRNFTLIYRLTRADMENQENYLTVCKKMFLNTFSVSEQFVYTSLEKRSTTSGLIEADMRGRHSNHRKIITENVIKSVCDHIKSLQPVESHYTRSRSNKLYLDGDLNFQRLFDLYNEWFDTRTYSSKASTERQYRDIVNEHFKISFYVPKKDQCDKCHIYKNISSPTLSETQLHEEHLKNKEVARKKKLCDKELAKISNGKLLVATFDFQKVLTAPYGNISVLYYKRKLSVFNLTVFNLAEQEGTCFMWHEGQGRRGANEVASCLFKYIAKYKDQGVSEFRFWSDNCVGQNRNRIVYAMYMQAVIMFQVTIHHCFLEVGHTQNEGDSVHALIEKSAKNKLIYTPFEWFCLVRWAKQKGKPYIVEELQYTDFLNYKTLLKGNWVKSTTGDKVQWNKIREVFVKPEDPFKLFYKYDLAADDYHVLCIKASTRRQCVSSVDALYENRLPIPKAKKDDLMNMCKSQIIPSTHHDFFQSLPESGNDLTLDSDSD